MPITLSDEAAQVAFGDDYELLLTAPPHRADALALLAGQHKTRLTCIGRLSTGTDVRLLGADWPPALFNHFEEARA